MRTNREAERQKREIKREREKREEDVIMIGKRERVRSKREYREKREI